MRASRWIGAGVGVVLAAAVTAGGYVIYAQDQRIDELRLAVTELADAQVTPGQLADQAARLDTVESAASALLLVLGSESNSRPVGASASTVTERLEAIEDQLGMGTAFSSLGGVEDRLSDIEASVDQVEWEMNAVCSKLNLEGFLVAC